MAKDQSSVATVIAKANHLETTENSKSKIKKKALSGLSFYNSKLFKNLNDNLAYQQK